MRRDALSALVLGALIATGAAGQPADTLDLARKLVHFTGGVALVLHSYEPGLAATTKAPEVFLDSFNAAMKENQAAIAAADEAIARVYAGIYAPQAMAAEVDFYESPEGQAIMAKNRGPYGSVIWPGPDSINLSAAESRALAKFNTEVEKRAEVAAKNPKAMDQVLSAETAALIAVRHAAFVNYCKVQNCRAENVTIP